jgi:hypothetical protein
MNSVSSLSVSCIHKLRIRFCNSKMNSVGIAQSVLRPGYGLNRQGVGVRFQAGVKKIFLLRKVRADSEVHLTSYAACTRGSFLGVKVTVH